MATFFNQATLTYRGGATNSNIVAGEWTLIPGTTVLQVSGIV